MVAVRRVAQEQRVAEEEATLAAAFVTVTSAHAVVVYFHDYRRMAEEDGV